MSETMAPAPVELSLIRSAPARDLIEEGDQTELIMIREWDCVLRFRVGDIANKYVVRALAAGLPVTDRQIFAAVGRFCGKAERTVRYYAEQAAFYPPDVRETYKSLPFSMFVFARSQGERAREVLDYALDWPLLAQHEVEQVFRPRSGLQDPPPPGSDPALECAPSLSNLSDPDPDDPDVGAAYTGEAGDRHPAFLRYQLVRLASDLLSTIERLARQAGDDLPEAAAVRLLAGVGELRRALELLGPGE